MMPRRSSLPDPGPAGRAAVLALLLVAAGPATADDARGTWVESTGTATVDGDASAEALATARSEALRHAVEDVLGRLLGADSEAMGEARATLLGDAERFVLRYREKSATCEAGACTVMLRAEVARGALRTRLDALGLTGGVEEAWIRVEVSGLAGWSQLQRVAQGLEALPGVHAVRQRRMTGDAAVLDIRTNRGARQVATDVATRSIGGVALNVLEVGPERVSVRVGR